MFWARKGSHADLISGDECRQVSASFLIIVVFLLGLVFLVVKFHFCGAVELWPKEGL